MRIEKNVPPVTIDGRSVAFRDLVLALGDGSEPTFLLGDDPDPSWIKIPDEFIRRTCEATIIGIVNAEGWSYNCCPRCARKVCDNEGTYHCENCGKDANDFKQRYKLIVRVEDKSGMTTFTLFNKEAGQLIGIPVETAINSVPQVTPIPPRASHSNHTKPSTKHLLQPALQDSSIGNIPAVIKNVIGKKCVFNIKINAYNTERGYEDFTVYRLTECVGTQIEDVSN
ncbi:hypothetical protein AgCh_017849 [Apium graveolens]